MVLIKLNLFLKVDYGSSTKPMNNAVSIKFGGVTDALEGRARGGGWGQGEYTGASAPCFVACPTQSFKSTAWQ